MTEQRETYQSKINVGALPPPREMALAINALLANGVLAGRSSADYRGGYGYGTDRDYYKVLGWRRELIFDDFLAKYQRQDIAQTVVDLPASESFREPPELLDGEGETATDETEFVKATRQFFKKHNVWYHLENVDRLSGIGRYGVLLIGTTMGAIPDGAARQALAQPVGTLSGASDILYLRAFDEGDVSIKSVDKNPFSPRFGLPETYIVDLGNEETGATKTGTVRRVSGLQADVHWSRVIHVAEKAYRSTHIGTPRLEPVYNTLDDLLKVVGGAAEATWKLVYKGLIISSKEGYRAPIGKNDTEALSDLEDEIQEYVNDLRRFLILDGMDVHDMGGQSVDVSSIVDILVSLVAANTRIPKRLLLGSERGELASSQDQSNWAGHIRSRRTKHVEPMIIRPFIGRLVEWGVLPAPTNGEYTIKWKPLFELDDVQKADVSLKKADAISKLSGGAPSVLVEESEAREIVGLPAQRPNQDVLFDLVPELPEGDIPTIELVEV